MDNQQEKKKGGEKMPEPKQTEVSVKSKVNVAQSIGIAIAALAIIGGITAAAFALFGGGPNPPAIDSAQPCTLPAAFTLSAPANGATNQDDAVLLKWNASSGAASYDVYLGKTITPSKVSTVTTTSYNATALSIGTKYYWKVVARNGCGSTSSAVWNFTTAGWAFFQAQNYTVGDYSAACGGQKACDIFCSNDATKKCKIDSDCVSPGTCNASDTSLNCAEYNAVWLICSGTTNRCPENQEEKCMQQSLCTCSGHNPGLNDCIDWLATLTDPCL